MGDDDPERLAMAYVMTFVAGNAAYVLHTGAGVRGGGVGDHGRGRPANLFEVSRLDRTLAAISSAQRYLPSGLANWDRLEVSSERFPFSGIDEAMSARRSPAVYASSRDDRFVAAVLGTAGPLTLQSRAAMEFEIRHPLTGAVASRASVGKGDTVRLDGADSYVVIGRFLSS
jgi:hypothetical protein